VASVGGGDVDEATDLGDGGIEPAADFEHLGTWPLLSRFVEIVAGDGGAVLVGVHGWALLPV